MDLAKYCQTAEGKGWEESLSPSAQSFVEALALPRVHPQCQEGFVRTEGVPLTVDEMPAKYFYEKDMNFAGQACTIFWQIAPALLAMAELWLRLFACVIVPLVFTYILTTDICPSSTTSNGSNDKNSMIQKNERRQVFITVLGLVSCVVLFTDTLYCQAFGRQYGGSLLFILTALGFKRSKTFKFYRKKFAYLLALIWFVTIFLLLKSGRSGLLLEDDPGIDIPTIEEGMYYSHDNKFMSRVAELWPESARSYNRKHKDVSPYPTGDILTAFPFLLNKIPDQKYNRLWVKSEVDDEAVALDIAFPLDGVHRIDKPIFLILHGLSGGSHEDYVKEFVQRRRYEGHTCIVMIARGMMDTPVFGWNIFHGARITDVDVAAKSIRKGLAPTQMIAGVGYSMGKFVGEVNGYILNKCTN